jgi:hypothetical protein
MHRNRSHQASYLSNFSEMDQQVKGTDGLTRREELRTMARESTGSSDGYKVAGAQCIGPPPG